MVRDIYEGMNNIKRKNWDYYKKFRKGVYDDVRIGYLVIYRIDRNIG